MKKNNITAMGTSVQVVMNKSLGSFFIITLIPQSGGIEMSGLEWLGTTGLVQPTQSKRRVPLACRCPWKR